MSTEEVIHPLDKETLHLFALKGREKGSPDPFNPNGAPVRRVIQILRDLAKKPLPELRVLDLACGEGVYAIETALRGASVLALDGRTERMNKGKEAAERLKLNRLRFEQNDVRRVNIETHGQFDIVYLLGILYHLDVPDVFYTLENIYAIVQDFVVIDTHISLNGKDKTSYKGSIYMGAKWREHGDNDPEDLRQGRLLASLDNAYSFWFTRESLIKLLGDIGFTSIFECHAPLDPTKQSNRVTLIAMKGKRTRISAYPWMNDKTDEEIKTILLRVIGKISVNPKSFRAILKTSITRFFRSLGYEIRRL